MNKLKVALIGVYPPPYGGVSVHVQRLLAGCLDNDIRCVVFDNGRHVKKVKHVFNLSRIWNWLRFLASRQDIVHVHTSSINWVIPVIFFYLARMKGAGFVLSYHSLRNSESDFGVLGLKMMKTMLRSTSHCIAINSEIKEKLVSMGARPEKVTVIPAYLPPVIKEEEIGEIPPDVWDFMERHTPLISANAYAIVKYRGQDLYGIDMCVEMCAVLKKDYPGVGLVFCLPSIGDPDYFNELKRRISVKGIEVNFLFQTRPCQFYPVLMKSDIFVRPTNTDSYGVSVAEAIHFKVPAIASDVCQRPGGTILFENRNVIDFTDRVKTVWENYTDYKAKLESLEVPDVMSEILNIYRHVVAKESDSSLM
jgi:glycosyltransferase involved in cell wall biosynthesis